MIRWRSLPQDRSLLYTPIGFHLIDDFTGNEPAFKGIEALLSMQDEQGHWYETDVRPVVTPSSVWTYPGLGRSKDAASQVPKKARVDFKSQDYIPVYQSNADGVEFDVYPYDDSIPPQVIPDVPQDLVLLPSGNYPFPNHVPVLRGCVKDTNGNRIENVLVTQSVRERVLTDEKGDFSLPLRWVNENVQFDIDAADQRSGKMGQISVTLPQALAVGQTIVIA